MASNVFVIFVISSNSFYYQKQLLWYRKKRWIHWNDCQTFDACYYLSWGGYLWSVSTCLVGGLETSGSTRSSLGTSCRSRMVCRLCRFSLLSVTSSYRCSMSERCSSPGAWCHTYSTPTHSHSPPFTHLFCFSSSSILDLNQLNLITDNSSSKH